MIVREDFPLAEVLYYRIGGSARILLECARVEDVLEAVDFVESHAIERTMVIGLGSNLLFPDGSFDGAVIRIVSDGSADIRDLSDGKLQAFAGETLDDVIDFGFHKGYVGLEWAGGLPGTVGAGVRGNVGAFGGEMKDVLGSAQLLDTREHRNRVIDARTEDLGFSYRNSLVKAERGLLVLSATLQLRPAGAGEVESARARYASNVDYRRTNHPMELPSCGSTFKNISAPADVRKVIASWPDVDELVRGRWHGKVSMGYVVHRLGLSGLRIGNAAISDKHSNFVVNLGGASFDDVYSIIRTVQDRTFETFGFVPEPEVEIVSGAQEVR